MTALRKWGHKARIMFVGQTLFQQLNPCSSVTHWVLYLQVREKACYCCVSESRHALIICANPPLPSKDAWHWGFAVCKIHLCTPDWPLQFSWHGELHHGNLCLEAQPELAVPVVRKPNGTAHHAFLSGAWRLSAKSVNKWQNLCACGLVPTLEIYGILLSCCAVAAALQLESSWH